MSKISRLGYKAYLLHKSGAQSQRGIKFDFTFDEWVAWWEENLGPDWFQRRGRGTGKYVMARYGDSGPYAGWNVKCITHSQNSKEQPKRAVLTEDQVRTIYLNVYEKSKGNSKSQLAKQFGVSKDTVRSIRRKRTWRSVTDLLD